jgi:nucleoside-diphosphate-sugar epimerase
MSRYFVTGATGFVGGRVAAQLREAGHHVVALVRDPARAGALAGIGVELVRGDVTDRATLAAPMRDADGVFHIAGWYKIGARDPQEGERINVDGTRNVLEVMRELRIPRGVYTSTLAVYGDTHGRRVDESHRYDGPFASAYDLTKWRAHHVVAAPMMRSGLPLVIVQPGLVYGPGDTSSVRTTLIQYLTRRLPLVPAGVAYSWAHIDDVARGHVLAMEHGRPGQSYHLAGPAHSLLEALALAERITGVRRPALVAPPWLMRAMSALMTPVAAMMRVDEQFHPESLRVLAGLTYLGRSEKAERELGWSARPLEVGLRETLAHEMALLGMPAPAVLPG